jgi:hypothetical protein
MRVLLMFALILLPACAVTPGDTPDGDAGIQNPKEDLVERILDAPDDMEAHADLLRLQIRAGDERGARATVTHALRHNEDDFRAHLLEAQFYRWQADLINAERALIAARDLAPNRLEPRVALSGLYNQTYLEAEEMEQRRIALELADEAYRPEFMLDYAFAAAHLGRDDTARELAFRLVQDRAASSYARSRAWLLLAELNLRTDQQSAAAEAVSSAIRLAPRETGIVQFAARMVCVLEDPEPLAEVFRKTLETQDALEPRWAALFGNWMLAVRRAHAANESPLKESAENWWQRLEVVAPGHPDTLTRRVQLLSLYPEHAEAAAEAAEELEAAGLGEAPATPGNLAGLLSLWRAEDALRIGAPGVTIHAVDQLEVREPTLQGLDLLRMVALFRARDDDTCLQTIEAWMQEDRTDELILSMRWWILLRQGRSRDVLVELEAREAAPSNATLWVHAVARFHTYRQ